MEGQESNPGRVQGFKIDFDDLGSDPFSAVSTRGQEPLEEAPTDDIITSTGAPGEEDEIIDDGIVKAPPSEGGDSDDEQHDEISEDLDDNPNLYYFIQEELKKDGFIDPDKEFDQNVDGMTVYNAYKEKLQKDMEPIVRQEVLSALEQEGFEREDLLIARAYRQGVDPRLLSQNSMYELYSKLGDDVPVDDQLTVISQMYRERGFNEVETKNQIAIAEQADKVEELFDTSRQYFGQKWNQFVQQEEQRSQQRNQSLIQEARKAEELLNRVVTTQEVFGEKLTPAQAKEINDAVRQMTEVVEVDGVKQKASELQKFIVDFYNNPEFRLLAFKIFKFRNTDREQLETEAKKKVEDEFLGGYKQRLIKHKELSKNKEVREQLNEKSKSSQPIFIDLSTMGI